MSEGASDDEIEPIDNCILLGFFVTLVTVSPVNAELRHHWPLDETSGLVAADVASGFDGALANFGNSDDSHWVDGRFDGALSLGTGSTLGNQPALG